MTEQAKFQRLLEMIMLMSNRYGSSIESICERLDMSQRTAYRYITTFRDAGFVVTKKDKYYILDLNKGENKRISELLHFSEEEAHVLSKAIHAIDDDSMIKSNLVKKLYSLYDFDRVSHSIIKKEHSDTVNKLVRAIKNKKAVILKDYKSSKSNTISNRQVEPFGFTYNYISVWCYEPSSKSNKLFKTSRISEIETLSNKWEYEDKHKEGNLDVFRISSFDKRPVKLKMTLRAANLLTEEYPLAEEFLIPQEKCEYIFDGWVSEWEGVGRFVLGLMDEIEVIKPAEFRTFLEKRIKNKKI